MTDSYMAGDAPVLTRDAVGLLTQDHRKAQMLFREFMALGPEGDPAHLFDIARRVCGDLLIHMEIEEALFYPEVAAHIGNRDLVEQARSEHKEAKRLIRHIGEVDASHPAFVRKMNELAALINAHIAEEETVLFPKALVSGIDLAQIGEQLHVIKNRMRVTLGLAPEP